MTVLKLGLILFVLFVLLVIYSCLRVSSMCSREEEKREMLRKINGEE